MDTVAHVKFIGKNITRNGLVLVESKEDIPMRAPHRSVTFVQSNTSETFKTTESIEKTDKRTKKAPEWKDQTNGDRTEEKISSRRDIRLTGLQTSAPFSLLDADFPPLDNSSRIINQISSSEPSRKDRVNDNEGTGDSENEDHELPSIDEILASKLSNPSSVKIAPYVQKFSAEEDKVTTTRAKKE